MKKLSVNLADLESRGFVGKYSVVIQAMSLSKERLLFCLKMGRKLCQIILDEEGNLLAVNEGPFLGYEYISDHFAFFCAWDEVLIFSLDEVMEDKTMRQRKQIEPLLKRGAKSIYPKDSAKDQFYLVIEKDEADEFYQLSIQNNMHMSIEELFSVERKKYVLLAADRDSCLFCKFLTDHDSATFCLALKKRGRESVLAIYDNHIAWEGLGRQTKARYGYGVKRGFATVCQKGDEKIVQIAIESESQTETKHNFFTVKNCKVKKMTSFINGIVLNGGRRSLVSSGYGNFFLTSQGLIVQLTEGEVMHLRIRQSGDLTSFCWPKSDQMILWQVEGSLVKRTSWKLLAGEQNAIDALK